VAGGAVAVIVAVLPILVFTANEVLAAIVAGVVVVVIILLIITSLVGH
jgi:hypothetical protein